METPLNNRRKGKVACLPFEQRLLVNQWLRDGVPYSEIITRLAAAGHADLNDQNITNWYQGGFQDWLREQARIDTLRARSEAALEMVREVKRDGTLTLVDANEMTLAGLISETLEDFDAGTLKTLMADDPKQFFNLAMTVTKQSNEQRKRELVELDYQKYRDQVAEAKAKIDAVTNAARSKGGLTPEALQQIEEAAALL